MLRSRTLLGKALIQKCFIWNNIHCDAVRLWLKHEDSKDQRNNNIREENGRNVMSEDRAQWSAFLGPLMERGEVGQGKRFSPGSPRWVGVIACQGIELTVGCREKRNRAENILWSLFWDVEVTDQKQGNGGIKVDWGGGKREERAKKGQSCICRLLGSMFIWAQHLITAGCPVFLPNYICNPVVYKCVVFSVSVCEH